MPADFPVGARSACCASCADRSQSSGIAFRSVPTARTGCTSFRFRYQLPDDRLVRSWYIYTCYISLSPAFGRELLRQLGILYLPGGISSELLRALRNFPLSHSRPRAPGFPIGALLPASHRVQMSAALRPAPSVRGRDTLPIRIIPVRLLRSTGPSGSVSSLLALLLSLAERYCPRRSRQAAPAPP